ncbi:MAG TPA: hypothetical protein VNG69_15735 [Casimicrobiaceae bacterium]|nr:hypothetical protein [Casimicrobiaceae bacterium]
MKRYSVRIAAAVLSSAATFACFAQTSPAPPAAGGVATTPPAAGGVITTPPAATPPSTSAPANTTPSAGRGLNNQPKSPSNATPPRSDALGSGTTGISGGVPAIGGVTPNRAELASSAFTKLDAGSRGYITLDDVRQLQGFESAFRQADQNGDGRLNASEFNVAWAMYTGNVR